MIPSVSYLLTGYRILKTDGIYAARLLEVCRRRSFSYENFQNLPDGGISLRFSLYTARILTAICADYGIPLIAGREGGLPILLRRLLHRSGLVVGFLLGLALFLAAQSVVWDIRISGNQTVSNRSVEQSLAACGLSVGTPLRGFRADVTENNVLLLDDRLAWLSINRKGTVAYVEVREAVPRPAPESDAPCDLIAAEGGIIERVELESGNVRVTAGQMVGKGDILVSGLFDSTQQGIRFTTAKARVYARTTRVILVKIPLTYRQKTYQTEVLEGERSHNCEKSLIFFGNHIKFKKKTGNRGEFCDTIENEKSCGPIEGVGFPISVKTTWYLPYTLTEATRTYAEAEELAYFELAKSIAALPGGAELIQKTIRVHHAPDALTLTCTLTCIEDIGTVRPIEVENG